MEDNSKISIALMVTIVILIWATVDNATLRSERDTMRKQAVEKGYAEWVVNKDNEAEWRWKTIKRVGE